MRNRRRCANTPADGSAAMRRRPHMNDPTPDPAGQEPLLICDHCGPTRGSVLVGPPSLCLTCLVPGAVCSRCSAGAPLSDWEGHWYCQQCYWLAVVRAMGRLEAFKFLGKKPSRRVIPAVMDAWSALPERRPGGGGRKPTYPTDVRQDLAKRACEIHRRGVPWTAIASLGPSGVTLYRWHKALKRCPSCETN